MSVESTLNEIKDLLAKQSRGGQGGQGTNANLEISSEAIEEANERVAKLREEMQGLKDEIAKAQAAGEAYGEAQEDLTAVQAEYNKEIRTTQAELRKTAEQQKKNAEGWQKVKDALTDMSSGINDVQSYAIELERTGAASKEVSRMAIRMGDSLRISGVDYQEVTQATKALVSGVTDFTMMGAEMQKSLIKDAALFAEAGVSNETYTKGLQVGMKQMGLSAEDAAGGMREIRKTALALNVPVSELTEDFIQQEEKLAQLGDTGIHSFKELARISKVTGVEMGKLINMTDKFDTFEGAAEQAGSLNAALGGNFVDSMSLMMEDDPAERFKIIRDAIEDSGTAVEDMTRKQKMFMASAAGFENVSDFAAAMSGDLGALQKEAAGAETSDAIPSLEAAAQNIRSQTELAVNAAKAIEPAYGTLAAKAMVVVDEFAPGIMDAAAKLNEMNIAMTEKIPNEAAAGLGMIEGAMGWWDKLMEIKETIIGIAGSIALWKDKLKPVFDFMKKGFDKFKSALKFVGDKLTKLTKSSLTRIPKLFGNMWKSADKLANTLGNKLGSKALGTLVKKIPLIGGVVSGLLNGWESLTDAFDSFANGNIAEGIGNVFASIFKFADGFLSAVPGFFVWIGQLFGWVDDEVDTNSLISSLLSPIFDGLMGSWLAFIENFEGFGSDFVNILKEIPHFIWDTFTDIMGIVPTLMDGVLQAFGFDAFAREGFDNMISSVESIFGGAIDWITDFLGISSPSKKFIEIGKNMIAGLVDSLGGGAGGLIDAASALIDAFIQPWKSIGSFLMEIIQPALDMVPDSIKNLFMGDTATTAGNLQAGSAPAGAAATAAASAAGGTGGSPQVINISLTLDGKEIDKKVINLIGGVAKEAVL